jgi:hypothetical protein
MESEWLKVEKVFTDKYSTSPEFGCASNMTSSVLLKTTISDELKRMGQAREVTNKI